MSAAARRFPINHTKLCGSWRVPITAVEHYEKSQTADIAQ